MIAIVCWNIRYGEGRDGRVDLARIVDTAKAMGDASVLCFQEVARHFAAIDNDADQVALFAQLLPGYEAVFGAGTDLGSAQIGKRRQFGNLILTRLPVLEVGNHLLPRPATEETRHMQRGALEVTLSTPSGPVRVITTHLEYFSVEHRAAQVERLRVLHQAASAHPLIEPTEPGADAKPKMAPIGRCPTVLCGDFNMEQSEPAYAHLLQPFDDTTPAFVDAWDVVHPGVEHPATCGIYELVHWLAPNCRDFMFITTDLAERARALDIDAKTDASDHQPLRLRLDL